MLKAQVQSLNMALEESRQQASTGVTASLEALEPRSLAASELAALRAALPRAVARRAGSGGGAGCYCHVLVPRATAARAHRQSQRLAVHQWMLTPHLSRARL